MQSLTSLMDQNELSLRIEDIVAPSRVRIFNFDKKIPLDFFDRCSACEKNLRPICIFTGLEAGSKIRFGLCEHCGYMGYLDRPKKTWMIDFYNQKWDRKFIRTKDDIFKSIDLPKKGGKAGRYLTFSLIERINADKGRPVCEIGAGYGEVLKNFERAGFRNLIAVENSQHRADFIRKNFGFKTLAGEFENESVQKELNKFKPIGIIFSHHMLEHTYNPSEIISLASSLQSEGDYLFLSLPNAAGEHINYALFYLVHLHSFTKESLEVLLNRNGYEIAFDNSPDNKNIVIAAKKVSRPEAKLKLSGDYLDKAKTRFKKGLGLEKIDSKDFYELSWAGEKEETDSASIKPTSVLNWNFNKVILSAKANIFHRFSLEYRMLASRADKKILSDDAPLEIQFKKDIKFLIK